MLTSPTTKLLNWEDMRADHPDVTSLKYLHRKLLAHRVRNLCNLRLGFIGPFDDSHCSTWRQQKKETCMFLLTAGNSGLLFTYS